MGACLQFIELVTKGWIVLDGDDGKKVLLKDGSHLPMQDNTKTKKKTTQTNWAFYFKFLDDDSAGSQSPLCRTRV